MRDQRSKQPRRTNDYHVQSHCGEHHQHAGHRSCDSPMHNHNISRHNGLVTERERKETGKGLGKGWFVGDWLWFVGERTRRVRRYIQTYIHTDIFCIYMSV